MAIGRESINGWFTYYDIGCLIAHGVDCSFKSRVDFSKLPCQGIPRLIEAFDWTWQGPEQILMLCWTAEMVAPGLAPHTHKCITSLCKKSMDVFAVRMLGPWLPGQRGVLVHSKERIKRRGKLLHNFGSDLHLQHGPALMPGPLLEWQ